VLKKPFDNIEVLQLAETLSRKWQRAHAGSRHLAALQQMIRDRSNELTGKTDAPALADDELAMAAQMVDTQVQEHLVLENELRQAIERGELAVHYQPLVAITTQHPVSVEALVRWEHPTKGWIPPVRFIPIAEESGLIFALGEFVLRTACAQVREWELAGIAVVPVAVNVSAMQLQDQNFVAIVRDILRETGLRPNLLALELTESALLENMQDHIPALRTLRSDGIAIEIDDFGTGYSSLSYLKELPLDAVKIDRSFIREVDVNPVDAAILSAIVAMAHSVNLRVVAEGVETAQQLQVIGRHACDIAQGYFFARPMPAEECANFLVEASERDSLIDNVRAATSGFAATH
jgi:EAL domain-containing protein (putative c-di-GMP-specific phosphodiesterase class I)